MARYDHLQLVRLPERMPRRKTGGALLGDRIRMNAPAADPRARRP